ncbi:hypothetical protein [Aquiflexum gelatinilyticum]|uniref:hypothetical protein n=1 Tax=Aquiflexum gelatinilyticum TaxID=2961943 RepID=UPI0021686F6D|nr:hypothetical protein [Aquiflexum gelatinilyticum]MCS4434195.1 hypothetical protein [Aquiflexum gelatinilyticum]
MEIDDFLELLPHDDETKFKKGLITHINLLIPEIHKYEDSRVGMLLSLHSGDYVEFLDQLQELMVRELRHRLMHFGIDVFNSENGMGLRLKSEKDLENKVDNMDLMVIAIYMGAITPTQERCLFAVQSEISLLEAKMNVLPSKKQRKKIKEVLLAVHIFFETPKLEKWNWKDRFFFMVRNSELDDLIGMLKPMVDKFSDKEKEETAEKLFHEYLLDCYSDLVADSFGYGLRILWFSLPEKNKENLISKYNLRLKEASEEDVLNACNLLSHIDVFRVLSDDIKGRLLNLRFSDMELLLANPILMNGLMIEFHDYGIGLLAEENYKSAAEVFLNFYFEYGDEATYELHNYELSASMFIPVYLCECSPELVACFKEALKEFVAKKMKDPIEKKGLAVLNDLIEAINNRADLEEGKKLGLIEV